MLQVYRKKNDLENTMSIANLVEERVLATHKFNATEISEQDRKSVTYVLLGNIV